MLVWAFGFLCSCLLIKVYKARKRMSGVIVLYLIILLIDLLVGGSLIVWKCWFREDEEECMLATGGTLGSVAIWIMVMLLCPLCMNKWSICELIQGLQDGIKHKLEQNRPLKNRDLCVESKLFLPSKPTFQGEKGFNINFFDENSNGIGIDNLDVSIIPSGKGTVRGAPNIIYTSDLNKRLEEGKVNDKYTEVNET